MAVQLSAGLWIMNNEIRQIIERRGYSITEEDSTALAKLREEYYHLTEKSHFVEDPKASITGPNVFISGLVKEVPVISDKEKYYNLFEEVAGILKKYYVNTDIYRRIGRVFEEMKREPSADTKKAIDCALNIINNRLSRNGTLERMCWETQKKQTKCK